MSMRRFGLAVLLVTLFAGVAVYSYKNNKPTPLEVSAQTQSTDWPQLQHDQQRTGFAANATVRTSGSYSVKWVWHPTDSWTPISDMSQPVVAFGKVFISDFKGAVYALDKSTGAEIWKYQTGGDIYAGTGISGNNIVVGSQDGKLYAIDQQTGALSWSHQSSGGIATSPLILNDGIVISNKAGEVQKISPTGSLVWSTNLGTPVLMSPAANNQGTVFVGAENLKAYALNGSNGNIIWERQLNGDSFRYGWPVVAESQNVVFFRTEPQLGFHTMLNKPSQMLENGRCGNFNFGECHPNNTNASCSTLTCDGFSSVTVTAQQYADEQTRIRNYLTANPNEQTFFALDTSTGQTKYVAPILYTGGSGTWPSPPVIDTTRNRAYVIYRSYYSMFDSSSTVRPYVDVAIMDLATGNISPFNCVGIGGDSCKINYEDFHLVGDEETRLSATGNSLLIGSWTSLGGIDLQSEASFFAVNTTSNISGASPILTSPSWPTGTYAGGYANPIPAISGSQIFYRTGLLGLVE